MSDKIFHPVLQWSQTKTNLTVQVDVRDLKDEKITIENKKITIDYVESGKHYYEELNLKDEIDAEKSTYVKTGFHTTLDLVKKSEGFWKSLTVNDKAIPNLKVDWSNYVDSDEEEEQPEDAGMGGLGNMANLMNMGNMGGMGGMGGLEGMGGMGGLGGLGGMGGMGGMPDFSKMGNFGNMGDLPAEEDDGEDEDDTEDNKGANLDDLEGTK